MFRENIIDIICNFIASDLFKVNKYPKKKESYVKLSFVNFTNKKNKKLCLYEVNTEKLSNDKIDIVLLDNTTILADKYKDKISCEKSAIIEVKFEYETKFEFPDKINNCFRLSSTARKVDYKKDFDKMHSVVSSNILFYNCHKKKYTISLKNLESYFLLIVQIRINNKSLVSDNLYPLNYNYEKNIPVFSYKDLKKLPDTLSLVEDVDKYWLCKCWENTTRIIECPDTGMKSRYRFILYKYSIFD